MFRPLNRRHDVNLCDSNCELLSLGEAVRRWHENGQFLMTEINGTDSYESDSADIPAEKRMSNRISKIEAFLAGQGFVKEIQASSVKDESSKEPAPSQESVPSAE